MAAYDRFYCIHSDLPNLMVMCTKPGGMSVTLTLQFSLTPGAVIIPSHLSGLVLALPLCLLRNFFMLLMLSSNFLQNQLFGKILSGIP